MADDGNTTDDDSDDDPTLAQAISYSRGTTGGSSSHYMTDKARAASSIRMNDHLDDHAFILQHEWNHGWFLPRDSIYFGNANHHAHKAVSTISNDDLKTHLKATTILAKGLKEEIASIKSEQSKLKSADLPPSSLHATASQVIILGKDLQDDLSFIST